MRDGSGVRRPSELARRRVRARLSLLLCLSMFTSAAGVARADDAEALRAGLLSDERAGWSARMETIGRSAELVGAVVGPLLRDLAPGHLSVAAYAAAWLADHPTAGRVMLDEDIVRRAGADPAFVGELRSALASDGAGWGRLVAVARGLATGTLSDAPLASLAAAFLRHEATASNVRDLLELWQRAEGTALGLTARESLAYVLGTPFESADEARCFLDADRGRTLFDWVRDLSRAKDLPEAPRFRRLLAEAANNLERVTTPDGLRPYLMLATTPWPEVRRLAAARAKAIDRAAAGWTSVFAESVDTETDVETLAALLLSFDGIKSFEEASASVLARNAARRLDGIVAPDDRLAIGLLAVLGRLGTTDLLRGVTVKLMDRKTSSPVLVAWLDAAAAVRGLSAEIRTLHQLRRGRSDAESVELRIHALGALARGGAESEGEASANASFLATILAVRVEETPDVAPSAQERAAAARGLEAFPVAASIEALASHAVAASEDPALARLAASVLGRMAAKQARAAGGGAADALDALVGVAGTSSNSAVRISAIDDLGRLAADGIEEPGAAREVFRSALDPKGPLDLRRAAARASAAVADPLALSGVFAVVADDVRSAVDSASGADSAQKAAERLVRALVRTDETADEAVAAVCRVLLDSSPAGADAAIALAAAAADAGQGRAALQATRARLLLRNSRAVGRTTDERIKDLDDAHRVLDALLRSADPAASTAIAIGAGVDHEIVTENLGRRVRQMLDPNDPGANDDAIGLARHRGLSKVLAAAVSTGLPSAGMAAAIDADAALLRRLRASPTREVRFAALIESTRAEIAAPRRPESADRARTYLAAARGMEPTKTESAEIDALETELTSDRAPAPR